MEKYPHKRIKIVKHNWYIYVVPKKHPKLLKACGTTHFNEKEIYVANHLSEKTLNGLWLMNYCMPILTNWVFTVCCWKNYI